ncbi:MAG: CBS domain-containing protein, partial [Gammaproteobacteria bacterium]
MADTSADTRGFIAHRPPFDTLPENVLDRVVGQLGRFELKAGDVFPPGDEDERTHLFIVQRGSIEMRTPSGRLCEKLGEGDLFTTQCQLVNLTEAETGTVMEKTVVLALRCTDLRTVCRESKEFAQHFRDSVTTRLRAAVDRNNQAMDAVADSLGSDIGDLVRHDPITLEASATIQQAARLMTDQRVSSVMIVDGGELAGLITDRDLRRSIASGLAHEDPVANIMTRDLKCISSGEPVMQALMVMTQLGVHHLPVMDGKRLIGMVTATDLTRHQSTHSALFASDVRKAASIGDLVRVSRKLPELQLHLANAGASALNIGEAVSFITDS